MVYAAFVLEASKQERYETKQGDSMYGRAWYFLQHYYKTIL